MPLPKICTSCGLEANNWNAVHVFFGVDFKSIDGRKDICKTCERPLGTGKDSNFVEAWKRYDFTTIVIEHPKIMSRAEDRTCVRGLFSEKEDQVFSEWTALGYRVFIRSGNFIYKWLSKGPFYWNPWGIFAREERNVILIKDPSEIIENKGKKVLDKVVQFMLE